MSKAYETSDIQVLDYPENIQRRPGMYVGGTGLDALYHLAYELIDNAVDEALAGACTHINVEVHHDGSMTVTDDGRGIDQEKIRSKVIDRNLAIGNNADVVVDD